MDFFDVVQSRYSYRKKLDASPLPLEDLKKIVQAGVDAPSGCNAQTTGFLIIRDPQVVNKIKSMDGANGSMASAPAYIACHINKSAQAVYEDKSFEVEDCAAATENILLAAAALGYATVWIDGWLRRDGRADAIGALCGLDDSRVIRIHIPIGKAAEEQKRPVKKSFDQRVVIV